MDGQLDLHRLFPGDSEMARRMREFNWSGTEFGRPETWPENLRVSVSVCLPSRFPTLLWWGAQFALLYNDAYLPWLSEEKHPRALARPGRESWSEIWDTIGPMLEGVRATGTATSSEDMELYFARKLPSEEVYMTFSYSPILAADGKTVDGILNLCSETTERVVGARRLETLRKLGIRSIKAHTVERTCQEVAAVLRENPRDIPFAAIYVLDEAANTARMTSAVLPRGEHSLLQSVNTSDFDSSFWPLASVMSTGMTQDVNIEASRSIVGEAWPDPVTKALVLPISGPALDRSGGAFVVGVGPRRVLDSAYRTFFDLAARHIGTALADARAYEEERKRAEALAEIDLAKTAFFSNISHEFRTPLILILGPTEEALNTADGALSGAELELVHRNGLRLLKLVNALLDFSRIGAGRVEAVYQPTDIATFTAELASTFRSAMQKAGLGFKIDCEPIPEPVFVDHDMWEKIVLNLLSNAFKFTFQGKVAVSVRATDGWIELQVSDTGIGISEKELPHLFERFHRVAGAKGRTYEGTGIGLALVRELAGLHGGSVSVQGSEGKGSCFTVAIPMGKDHLAQDKIGTTPRMVSRANQGNSYVQEALRWLSPESTKLKESITGIEADQMAPSASALANHAKPVRMPELIVLADDNADLRDYILRLLGNQYRVHAVSNGTDALSAARELGADLILADVMMPGMDGFALLKALRADPLTKLKPVILLSARAGEESRVEGLEGGADDYLVKPFTARELLARLGAHLKMARIRGQATERERRLRTEVETERNRLRNAFAQGPAPIALLNGPGQGLVYVNDAYLALVNRSREQLLGKPFWEVFPEIEGHDHSKLLDKVYRTGETFTATERQVKLTQSGGGDRIYLDFTYSPMRNVKGEVEAILFQCVDVTDKVLARTRLEERVKQRTAELEKAQESLHILNRHLLLAQEEERRRLALELHDSSGQWLAALKWKLGSLPQQLGEKPELIGKELSDSLRLLDSLAQELRTVSQLLHPPLLDDAGLAVALELYVEGLFDRSGLVVDLQIDPALQRLPREIEEAAFRIVQEALTNVYRHAKTKSSAVRIKTTSIGISIEIQDKGTGIPGFISLDQPNVKLGIGVQGMRERVRQLRGSFDFQSGTSGTTVSVVLPSN